MNSFWKRPGSELRLHDQPATFSANSRFPVSRFTRHLALLSLGYIPVGCDAPTSPATLADYGVDQSQPEPTAKPHLEQYAKTCESQQNSIQKMWQMPLDGGWKSQPSNTVAATFITDDGHLELKVSLAEPDDYAEAFFDLRSLQLDGLPRNMDRTYDLRGIEILAAVRGQEGFRGLPDHPNGVQVTLKDVEWRTLPGNWLNATSAIDMTGMTTFLAVPDNDIGSKVQCLTVKFTLNSEATDGFKGSLYVTSVTLRPRVTTP